MCEHRVGGFVGEASGHAFSRDHASLGAVFNEYGVDGNVVAGILAERFRERQLAMLPALEVWRQGINPARPQRDSGYCTMAQGWRFQPTLVWGGNRIKFSVDGT